MYVPAPDTRCHRKPSLKGRLFRCRPLVWRRAFFRL